MPITRYAVVPGADPTVLPADIKKLPPQAVVIFKKIAEMAGDTAVDRKTLIAAMNSDNVFLRDLNTCQMPERVLSYFAPTLEKCSLIMIQREKPPAKEPKEKVVKVPKIKEPKIKVQKEPKTPTARKAKAVEVAPEPVLNLDNPEDAPAVLN